MIHPDPLAKPVLVFFFVTAHKYNSVQLRTVFFPPSNKYSRNATQNSKKIALKDAVSKVDGLCSPHLWSKFCFEQSL